MERIFELVALLLYWRTALVTALSVILAVTLAAFIPTFTGVAGIVLVCVGFGAGLLWDAEANPQPVPAAATPAQELSWPVAVLALAFFGALTGGWVSAVAGSTVVGAIFLLLGVAAVALHRSLVAKRSIPLRSLVISSVSLLVGLGVLVSLGALQEKPTSNPAYMDSPRSQEN